MEKKQLLKVEKKVFEVSGNGKSKEEAFNKSLSKLRQEVYKSVNGMILKMDPVEVYLLDQEETFETEKFLFFFMPREKTTYKLTYKFVVEIRYIDEL